MGREVRRVPADWQHPKHFAAGLRGPEERYKPLFQGHLYESGVNEWDEECAKWKAGWRPDYCTDDEHKNMTYEQWSGQRPHRDDYMPNWPIEKCTHLMMYESTSEGTPISPAFATPEELARWLADNGASAFGSSTATYEQWLNIARGGWAPDLIYTPEAGLQTGIESSIDQ
jgi:hypothetical protein